MSFEFSQFPAPSALALGLLLALELGTGRRWRALAAVLGLGLAMQVMAWVMAIASRLHPVTFDRQLSALDRVLGLAPVSAFAVNALDRSPALSHFAWFAYMAMPLVFALVVHYRREAPRLFWSFALATASGFVVYNLVPACGPRYLAEFGASIPVWVPRNAMPSLHFAWALLVALESRSWPRTYRFLAGAFLVLTFFGTLGSQQHYVCDLAAAVPFALAARKVAAPQLLWKFYASWRLRWSSPSATGIVRMP